MSKVIKYRAESGVRYGILIAEGNKFLHVILQGPSEMGVRKIPVDEKKYLEEVPGYSLNKMKKRIRSAAKRWKHRLSKEARGALRDA